MLLCVKIRCNDIGWFMNRIAVYLNQHIDGVVYSAPSILSAFATDRSILRFYPRIVAQPINTTDVRRLVKFSGQLATKNIPLPITVRGGGNSKTGADLGTGLIMSMTRLNRIQEIDTRQRLVRVQAGLTLGELQKALILQGLDFPVRGNPTETIGGLISRNAIASDNTKPGTIADFVETVEVVLSDGSVAEFGSISRRALHRKLKEKSLEANIYRAMNDLIQRNGARVEEISQTDHSGYMGLRNTKQKRGINLAPIFCGAEGTLGVITEVILRVEPVFETPDYVAIPVNDAKSFVTVTKLLQELKFTDIVFYDTELYNESDAIGKTSHFFRKASNDGYLILANAKDDSRGVRRRKMRKLTKKLPNGLRMIRANEDNETDFAALRENLLAYLNDSSQSYHLPLIDNVFIPTGRQVEFLDGVTKLAKDLGVKLAVFGAVEHHVFTVRPSYTPSTVEGRKVMISFMRQYLELVYECGGHAFGAAPEGRFLAMLTQRYHEAELSHLYGQVKSIFDPIDILNPGLKQEVDPRLTLRHFRTDYNTGILPLD